MNYLETKFRGLRGEWLIFGVIIWLSLFLERLELFKILCQI
jgi:hypothetical protein